MDIYEQLRRDEGVRLKPYTDTVGKLTIGVGRNLTDVGISLDEAEVLLQDDISKAHLGLMKSLLFYPALGPIRQAAILNMAFNLGIEGLLEFHKAIAFMQNDDWDSAATEILDSAWARQVGARAIRISEQLRTNQWV